MRYAIINDSGVVVNAVLWDGKTKYEPAGKIVPLEEGFGIGDGHVNGEFVKAPAPVVEKKAETVTIDAAALVAEVNAAKSLDELKPVLLKMLGAEEKKDAGKTP